MNDFWHILHILFSSSGSSSSSEEDHDESAFFVVDWSPLVLSCPSSVVIPLKLSSLESSSLGSGCSTMDDDDSVVPLKLSSLESSRFDSICSALVEDDCSTLICD